MLLKKALMEAAAVKGSFFGFQGSGKTVTMALLAIGLSKEYHGGAPVAMHDTEPGSDFLVPIYAAEKVEFFVHKSRAFTDMEMIRREAVDMNACVLIYDSLTHLWNELGEAYQRENQRDFLEFQDWRFLKEMWNEQFVTPMLQSPLHYLMAGRAGNEYLSQDKLDAQGNPTGKKEIIQGDTKFNAEKQFGHEPSLLVEMIARRIAPEGQILTAGRNSRSRRGPKSPIGKSGISGGSYEHEAHVLKDRTWALNGTVIKFTSATEYKPGDYKKVLDAFRPHIDRLAINKSAHRAFNNNNSRAGVHNDQDEGQRYRWKRYHDIQVETMKATMEKLYPGSTAANKEARAVLGECIFGVRSATALENLPLWQIIWGVRLLLEFEAKVNDGLQLPTEAGKIAEFANQIKPEISESSAKLAADQMVKGELTVTQAASLERPDGYQKNVEVDPDKPF